MLRLYPDFQPDVFNRLYNGVTSDEESFKRRQEIIVAA